MTDKEKIEHILRNHQPRTFEELVATYLNVYGDDFSLERAIDLMEYINCVFIRGKSKRLDMAIRTAYERATYLKCYLDGNMYTDEEAAKANVDIQRENAQAILDACKGAKE